ncbi:MAG: bifunctional riboflavin kinase/FAD synthetase [Tissierellia bacterium]|nr:bifunctional riboflavin kinase/FAD synthetase [Tissierellia bacterium]
MIKVIDLDVEERSFDESVIGLGNFDGVHAGHRTIMYRTIELAKEKNVESAVLLFKQHTNEVFPKMPPYYISSLEDKIEILDRLGIDRVYIIDFTMEFAQLTNEGFMLDFIRDDLNAHTVVCGSDYTFGKKSMGTVKELIQYKKDGLIDVSVVDDYFFDGKIASSTTIRNLISQGNFTEATKLLVDPYTIRATVVHGAKRGTNLLGFPTANLEMDFSYIMPADALYITSINIDGKDYQSMTSVGTNPTFTESKDVKVECYIMDFKQDIYGKTVKLSFLKKMRDQIVFPSAQDLIKQMEEDEKIARKYFDN